MSVVKPLAIACLALLATQCGGQSTPVTPPTIIASLDSRGIDTSLASFVVDAAGGLWVVDAPDYAIHRIDMASGKRSDFNLPQNAEPHGAVIGDDGALWLSDYSNSELLRFDSTGAMTAYPVGRGVFPYGLVKGAGKLWFVEHVTKAVGMMTPDGTVTTVPVPIPNVLGGPMARDDDGTLWVGGQAGTGTIGRLDVDGSFRLADASGQLGQLFSCPDGGVAYSSVSGSGLPPDSWVSHIGLLDSRGRSVHVDYQEPAPTTTPQADGHFQNHSSASLVGPPPPPGVVFFACTADGAWFVVDRAVVGHVDRSGHARYFPADALANAPASVTPDPARTAWVALGDSVVELSY